MSWVFTGLMKRAREVEREQARRLNEAYARWHKKHRELPHAVGDREQERRLLGTREREEKNTSSRHFTEYGYAPVLVNALANAKAGLGQHFRKSAGRGRLHPGP